MMNDSEIIKGLQRMSNEDPDGFSNDILDLINRQKAELEKFKQRQKGTAASGFKNENGKVVFYTNMLGGCRNEYANLDEVVKTLNELLQECYDKDEIAFHLKYAKIDAIKEFAEKLKARKRKIVINDNYSSASLPLFIILPDDIDKLVEEMGYDNAD